MSSYYAERGGSPAGKALTPFLHAASDAQSRATVPVSRLPSTSFTTLISNSPAANTLTEYPEPGQTTVFSVALMAGNVYDIKATTSFPTSDLRKTYVEEYYVRDGGMSGGYYSLTAPDGIWTIDDPIVNAAGTQDQKARVRQVLTFQDGTTRTETIVSDSNYPGDPKFDPAAFDVNGSLDLTQAFIPSPTTDPKVMFSSVVIYTVQPTKNYNFWFWQGTQGQNIIGVRYYTEKADTTANTYTAYTASFEKTLSTLTTQGGTYATTVQGVFVGSQYDALAESVLRQQVTYSLITSPYYTADTSKPATRITNMQSRVVNITGKKDFYLTQLNSDAVQLTTWATSTIFIPTGNATEILATDNAAFTFSRTQLTNPPFGTQPLVVQTVDTSGLGALATVYTSITEGTASATLPASANLPSSNALPANTEWTFSGQSVMGNVQPLSGTFDLSKTGTVEAWVYINVMTDTAGFVHKGIKADFTDESYSLQGWGNSGQIAFCIDGPGGAYDLVTSNIKLNTKKWYYLVGTWDTTAATPYINLYINGVQVGTAKPNNAKNGAQVVPGANLMIGSQIASTYNSTWGYFGLNGKIVGVNISATPMTAGQALTRYNQYGPSTVNW